MVIGGLARLTALESHFPQPHGSGRATGNSTKLASPPQISRVNGCSPPRNAFQAVSWAVFLTLSLAIFGIFIPFLSHAWKYIAYVVAGGIFLFHLVFHLIACCIDPADPNVRLRKDYSQPMPIFDRSKHAHVIQNHYCHLCKVTVTKKAKHCIACNKCVSGFDHHCKLLNNCVGNRNYWFFFSTVASAVAGLLCVIAVLLYVLIQYFVNPWALRTDPKYEDIRSANTWLLFLPLFPVKVKTQMVAVIGAAVLLLDLLGLLLLGQLLMFHIYLKIKKMTTLDYLTQTHEEEEKSKCQAERKGSPVQMGEGFLQQREGAGAPGSSAQGVKAKKSLLMPNCLCHLPAPVHRDRGSSAQEADDAPSPSSCGVKTKKSLLMFHWPCHLSAPIHPVGSSSGQEGDGAPGPSALGVQAKKSTLMPKCPCHLSTPVHPDGGLSAQEADDAPSPSSCGVKASKCPLMSECPCHLSTPVHPDGSLSAQEGDGAPGPSALGIEANKSLLMPKCTCHLSAPVSLDGGSSAQEADGAWSPSPCGEPQVQDAPLTEHGVTGDLLVHDETLQQEPNQPVNTGCAEN
nr:probable palmitoyltransferase ZDHHC11B [Saimiri boliviensis boliviensis]